MKNTIIGILLLLVIAVGLSVWTGQAEWQSLSPPQTQAQSGLPQLDLRIENQAGQTHVFRTEVADTPQSLSAGMMFRTDMPAMTAMLFVFPETVPVQFWMKNTFVPLDMLFVDENRVVRHIHANAVPKDQTLIPSRGAVKYVLEIPGGTASQLGITVGDKIFF